MRNCWVLFWRVTRAGAGVGNPSIRPGSLLLHKLFWIILIGSLAGVPAGARLVCALPLYRVRELSPPTKGEDCSQHTVLMCRQWSVGQVDNLSLLRLGAGRESGRVLRFYSSDLIPEKFCFGGFDVGGSPSSIL